MTYVSNHTICPHVITENIPLGFIYWSVMRNQLSNLKTLSHRWIGLSMIAVKKDLHCTNLVRPFNHKR